MFPLVIIQIKIRDHAQEPSTSPLTYIRGHPGHLHCVDHYRSLATIDTLSHQPLEQSLL